MRRVRACGWRRGLQFSVERAWFGPVGRRDPIVTRRLCSRVGMVPMEAVHCGNRSIIGSKMILLALLDKRRCIQIRSLLSLWWVQHGLLVLDWLMC